LILGFLTLEEAGSSPDSDFLLRLLLSATGGRDGGGSNGGDGRYGGWGGGKMGAF
jgi:hypothetical protein